MNKKYAKFINFSGFFSPFFEIKIIKLATTKILVIGPT